MKIDCRDAIIKASLVLCPPLMLLAIVRFHLYEELIVFACLVGLWFIFRRRVAWRRNLSTALYFGGVAVMLIAVHKASNHTVVIENGTNQMVRHIQVATSGWSHSVTNIPPGRQALFHYRDLFFDCEISSIRVTLADESVILLKERCTVSYWFTDHLRIQQSGDIQLLQR